MAGRHTHYEGDQQAFSPTKREQLKAMQASSWASTRSSVRLMQTNPLKLYAEQNGHAAAMTF